MQTFKKIGEGFLIAGFVFLFIILAFQSQLQLPTWLKIAGRMHPMFLHFPIVLLLLSFLSLWIPSHEQSVWNWFDGLRLVAAISAVVTAVMGLLLSLEEPELTRLLQWHKWSGVGVAFLALVFYIFSDFFIRVKYVGKAFTLFAGLLIFLTGHWGAGLTHGDNYLLEPMSAERKVAVEDAVVFNDVIKPILERKCLSCHREGNMKGGLLMENIAGMLKGGKTGPLFVPGEPEMSLLIQRIHLPVNEKKHMPPASKPALTDEESALLYAWIRSGALMKEKLVSLPAQDSFRLLATRTFATDDMPVHQLAYDFPPADQKTVAALNNNYRVIEPLALGAAALSVKFYGIAQFSSRALQELLPIKQQVTELSVSRMPVKDEDLKTISEFTNITRLNLNYTDITGSGLQYLKSLGKLQQLSLSGTAVKANAFEGLDSLPELSKIFVWDTPIDSSQAVSLSNRNKKWKIETGFSKDTTVKIALPPPAFRTPSGVLQKPRMVELRHPVPGVEIRYTTDGKKPDSIKSEIYKQPFLIDSTMRLKARAFREGWYGSGTAEAVYIMRRVKPDSVLLLTKPDARYAMLSPDQLSDDDLGDLNFANGQWVGYQKSDANFLLYFNAQVNAGTILLNLLRNTGPHIFPPVSIEVWGGIDKDNLKLLGRKKIAMPGKDDAPAMIQEQVKFPSTSLRYIKVNIQRLKALPSWHDSKGKPGWVMISEIVVN
jgi:hypothetical protein